MPVYATWRGIATQPGLCSLAKSHNIGRVPDAHRSARLFIDACNGSLKCTGARTGPMLLCRRLRRALTSGQCVRMSDEFPAGGLAPAELTDQHDLNAAGSGRSDRCVEPMRSGPLAASSPGPIARPLSPSRPAAAPGTKPAHRYASAIHSGGNSSVTRAVERCLNGMFDHHPAKSLMAWRRHGQHRRARSTPCEIAGPRFAPPMSGVRNVRHGTQSR